MSSYDDPALREVKIGVELIATMAPSRRVRAFPVYGDYRDEAPLSPIMTAVVDRTLDVAIVWGPTAGTSRAKGHR